MEVPLTATLDVAVAARPSSAILNAVDVFHLIMAKLFSIGFSNLPLAKNVVLSAQQDTTKIPITINVLHVLPNVNHVPGQPSTIAVPVLQPHTSKILQPVIS